MKKLMKINMVTLMVFAFCTIGMAQDEKQRMNREQMAEKQAMHIAHELAFDDATTQRFVETYCACQQEVWTLGPRHKAESATEEEAEKAIKERFERSRAILDLREKYYDEYSKFLTQKQIQRVYELEHQSMDRLNQHRDKVKAPHHPHVKPEKQ